MRANFVGIAPQVNGHIVELHVRDNQQVKEGDLLFLIDPRPYKIALERARATLALTRKEVDGLKNSAATAVAGISKAEAQLNASAAEVTRREMDPVVADAEIARLEAQFQNADDHLKRSSRCCRCNSSRPTASRKPGRSEHRLSPRSKKRGRASGLP